jgi:IS30 family transposase
VGASQSTISRELARNSIIQLDSELIEHHQYFADAAQRQALERQSRSGARMKYLQHLETIRRIEDDVLIRKWSPDASVGRLERLSGRRAGITARTFYNYVGLGLVRVKPIDLAQKTRRKNKAHRVKTKMREIGTRIDLRPSSVESREEFGHWEIDGVIGKAADQTELMTLLERKTRKAIVMKLENRTQAAVVKALCKLEREFGRDFPVVFKSITSDNGSEFLNFREMEKSHYKNRHIRTKVYYAHPYCASERGSNENCNGLLRRFVPKGKSIDTIPEDRIRLITTWLNALPRKILGYRTAKEAFDEELASIQI